jgi:hypothetical protein
VSSRLIPFPAPAVHDKCSVPSLPLSLHAAVASSRRQHRSLIVAAGQWALARGVSLPADHIALWAATVDEVTGPWRASALPDLVKRIAERCALAGCAVPADLPESLWHLYGFLADTGRLHSASDPLIELRAGVVVFATFDRFHPMPSPPPEPTAA